jgi:hypothetical protein
VGAAGRIPDLSAPVGPLAGSARQIEVSINAVKEVIAIKQAAYEQSGAMLEGNVSPETLQAQRLHCNQQNVGYYKECLALAAEMADRWEGVLESCLSYRQGLRPFPERATLEDTAYHHRDNDNCFTLTYDTATGEVSGRYDVVFLDGGYGSTPEERAIDSCTVRYQILFQGSMSTVSADSTEL